MYKPEYVERMKNNQLDRVPWLAPEVAEAVGDMRWCDAVVFVFPTWMFSVPAALKGFLDRTLLPGVAFTLPDSSTSSGAGATGLIAGLTNIDKIGVVTTSSSSPLVMLYGGDGPRKMMSRTLRVLCAPGCQVAWTQLYGIARTSLQDRQQFLRDVEKAYAQF
jgi:putative NADPH-quinone reductase